MIGSFTLVPVLMLFPFFIQAASPFGNDAFPAVACNPIPQFLAVFKGVRQIKRRSSVLSQLLQPLVAFYKRKAPQILSLFI